MACIEWVLPFACLLLILQHGFDSDDDDDEDAPKLKKAKALASASAAAAGADDGGDGADRAGKGKRDGEDAAPMMLLPEWIAKAAKKGYTKEEYVAKFWKVRPGLLATMVLIVLIAAVDLSLRPAVSRYY